MGMVNVATSCTTAVAVLCKLSSSFEMFFSCTTVLYLLFSW